MRIEGWEMRLAEYLVDPGSFAWGINDCALWSARWVRIATRDDYLSDWEGRYSTEIGAKRQMTARGFKDVDAVASNHLPAKPVPMAQRGDLVLYPTGSLGICNGQVSHFLAPDGLLSFPTLDCPKAWGVG